MGDRLRIHFVSGEHAPETHDVDLDLRPDHFLQSLDAAIADLQHQGHLRWFYRRAGVTLPHETDDDDAPDSDDLGELRQEMEIAVYSRPLPPHLVARERRGRVRRHLGKDRYKPY